MVFPHNGLMRTTRGWAIRARYQLPLVFFYIITVKVTINKSLQQQFQWSKYWDFQKEQNKIRMEHGTMCPLHAPTDGP